jgi:hypothetical protein
MLISRSCDAEADAVTDLLCRVGVRTARIDADNLATLDMLVDMGSRTVRLDGRWVAPTVTWVRHFSSRAIIGSGVPAYNMFLRDSWRVLATQVAEISGRRIGSQPRGPIDQLLLAQRHQIAVPRTVVASDACQAASAFQCSRLVIKAVHRHFVEPSPGQLSWIFPAIVKRGALADASLPGPPVVVQEYIEHSAELRVYWVHGQVHAFEISKISPVGPWLAADQVEVRLVEPPSAVVSATRCLAAAMEIQYGAFDFLMRDGTPFFLEVNQDGDWRWIEGKAGVASVTLSVAKMLCSLHQEGLSALPDVTDRRMATFNLLAFLSGA